jgi:hypothetical protein
MEDNNFSSKNKAVCSQFSNQQFIDYLLQQLSTPVVKEIDAHILQCQSCLDRLSHWSNMIKSRDKLVKQIQAKRPFFLGGSTTGGVITDTPARQPSIEPVSPENPLTLPPDFWHILQQIQPLPALFKLQLTLDHQRCQQWNLSLFLKLWFNKLDPNSKQMYDLDRHLAGCEDCQQNLQQYFQVVSEALQALTAFGDGESPGENSTIAKPIVPTVLLEIQLQDLAQQAKSLKATLEDSLSEDSEPNNPQLTDKMQQIEQKLATIAFQATSQLSNGMTMPPATTTPSNPSTTSPIASDAPNLFTTNKVASTNNPVSLNVSTKLKILVLIVTALFSTILSYWLHRVL